jgi:hypothetical protein
MKKLALAIAALADTVAGDASARDIEIEAGKSWVHKETGVTMPPALEGFTLELVKDFGESESDVEMTYRDRGSKTLLSIYLFRAGVPDVSVWQDRIIAMIRANKGGLGRIDGNAAAPAPITPAGGVTDSGSIVTFRLAGGSSTSTGSAVLRTDDWLVALRMSSGTLSEQELSNRLVAVVAGLPLAMPQRPERIEASYVIEPCADSAPITQAKRSKGGIEEVTMDWMAYEAQNAAVESASEIGRNIDSLPPYCREDYTGDSFSVYSRKGARSGYLIALHDAGSTIEVAPPISMWKTNKRLDYAIVMKNPAETMWFRGFRTLPSIAQVIAVINSEGPIGKAGRDPATRNNVTIFTADESVSEKKR